MIPNHTLSCCYGTAACGDAKYLAKYSLTCLFWCSRVSL